MRGLNKLIHAAALITILCIISCKKTDPIETIPSLNTNTSVPSNNYTPPAVTFSATVQGFVTNGANNPVSGVEVKTGNKTATTDINGYFKIDNAPFTGDFCYLRASKKGFFTGSTTIHGKAGSDFAADLVIQPQQYIASFPSAQGKTLTLQGGSSVFFPANGFVTSTGAAYTGNVNMAAVHLNPEAKNFSSLIPGGDLRAFDANGQNVQLFSYGMLNVEMRDEAGNLLQLAKGKKATLTMPVPQTLLSNAPTTIPLWYFDDVKGIWIEEGSAKLQGNNYVGTVTHFTAWNCDKPYPPSIIKGRVVDNEGNPLNYAKIMVDQRMVKTDDNGAFTALAIPGSQVIIDVYNESKGELMGIHTVVQALQANETKNIGDIVLKNASKTYANVIDCDGLPLVGYGHIKYGPFSRRVLITDEGCSFETINMGGEAEITFYSADLRHTAVKRFAMPSGTQTVNLGNVTVCGKNGFINKINFTYQEGNKTPIKVSYVVSPVAYCSRGSSTYTNIIFSDASSPNVNDYTYQVVFGFNGELPGTYALRSQPYVGFVYRIGNNNEFYIHSTDMALVLDKFGKRDELVSGTFSGSAVNKEGKAITITDGSLEVIRTY